MSARPTSKDKLDLANRILLDKNLSLADRVVGWYIADHINTVRGFAWCPQEHIARDLGIDERTVRRAIRAVAPYFAIDRSHRQHEYRIATPDNMPAIEPTTPDIYAPTPDIFAPIPDTDVPPSSNTSSKHPLRSIYTDQKQGTSGKGKPRKAKTIPLPDDWCPNATALRLSDSLKVDLADVEARFRDYLASSGKQYADYDAALRNFIRNTPKFNGTNHHETAQQRSVIAAADRLRDKIAEINRPAPNFTGQAGICGPTSAAVVRLIPKR